MDEEYAVTTKRVVTQAQTHLANKIKAQYGITDYTDDKSVLNNFALWLQMVRGLSATEAHQESLKIAPPTWGGLNLPAFHVVKKPVRKKEEITEPLEIADSPTEVFSDDELMDDPAPEERYNLGTYIMSAVGPTKRRTLHVMGAATECLGCTTGSSLWLEWRDNGERLCSTCFTPKERIAEAIQQGPDAEQSTDSESSSSEDVSDDEP